MNEFGAIFVVLAIFGLLLCALGAQAIMYVYEKITSKSLTTNSDTQDGNEYTERLVVNDEGGVTRYIKYVPADHLSRKQRRYLSKQLRKR